MTVAEKTYDFDGMQAHQYRILAKRGYDVALQLPEPGNLAEHQKENQIAVRDPERDNMVIAFFGPEGDAESLGDASLFQAAPHLYAACVAAHKAIKGQKGINHALKLIEDAVALAHQDVRF